MLVVRGSKQISELAGFRHQSKGSRSILYLMLVLSYPSASESHITQAWLLTMEVEAPDPYPHELKLLRGLYLGCIVSGLSPVVVSHSVTMGTLN